MIAHEDDREWRAWVAAGSAAQEPVRFTAPARPPGWSEHPWVELRALTVREELQRDSLGVREEYELAADGRAVGMRRVYDFEAMVQFDLQHCVVAMMLPVESDGGEYEPLREGAPADEHRGGLLDRLPRAVAEWLLECIEAVNMRRAEDREVLEEAKKA